MFRLIAALLVLLAVSHAAVAQEHDHAKMLRDQAAAGGWQLMQDGNVFVMFNHQSSARAATTWSRRTGGC